MDDKKLKANLNKALAGQDFRETHQFELLGLVTPK